MADPKNYELIYKLRKFNTTSLQNIEIELKNKAIDEARKIHKQYTDAIEDELGTDNFEVSSVACMADGIMSHVYTPADVPSGLGKKRCIYCGCDDFDAF